MEEDHQRSETVAALADMSESLASDSGDQQQQQQQQRVVVPQQTATVVRVNAAAVTTASAPVATIVQQPHRREQIATVHPVAVATNVTNAGVPVSLPVGSIIGVANASNGTTFNVITSDQLQMSAGAQFKQMLCVDNGFICESREEKQDTIRWNGELKATHIVIQNNTDENDAIQLSTQASNSLYDWTESANLAVLPVRCKSTNAELHKNKFGSGGRGRCIKAGNEWYTPTEFEAICGRASSKDWKRSIRFGGRSLQTLIDENILRPHATSCTCAACCDDENAAGPIRLFIPYKRRRKSKDRMEDESRQKNHKADSSRDGSIDDDSETELIQDKTVWPNFVSTDDTIVVTNTQETDPILPHSQHQIENGHNESKYKKLEDLSNKLLKVAYEFKKVIEGLKADEAKQQRKEHSIVDQLGGRNDVIETVGLQPASDAHSKRCANCNRDAFAECSLCRRTPYCSTFCQRKDWNVHQVECVRDATETVMLIVESSSTGTTVIGTQSTIGQ